MFFKKYNEKDIIENLDWKNKNDNYLKELQRFLDKTESIDNENLRKEIITQMLKCDSVLTNLCQEKIAEITEESNKNRRN